MAINLEIFVKQTLDNYRAAMLALNPKAVATPQQQIMITAICNGLVKVLKQTWVVGSTPAPISLGLNGVGLVLQPGIMEESAITMMQGLLGGPGGVALQPAIQAIMSSIATYFATAVEVMPVLEFGGQPLPPTNMVAPLIQAGIMSELPSAWQINMAKSQHGMDYIKSISAGIAAGMAVGVPGVVPPSTSPTVGLLSAKFI
jgi:hypothetical protein